MVERIFIETYLFSDDKTLESLKIVNNANYVDTSIESKLNKLISIQLNKSARRTKWIQIDTRR